MQSPIQESSKRCVYSISSAGSINIDDICYMDNQTIHLETKYYYLIYIKVTQKCPK